MDNTNRYRYLVAFDEADSVAGLLDITIDKIKRAHAILAGETDIEIQVLAQVQNFISVNKQNNVNKCYIFYSEYTIEKLNLSDDVVQSIFKLGKRIY